jgi:hypothetical protein
MSPVDQKKVSQRKDEVLRFLKLRGPLKAPEIAAALKISQSTFSRLVDAIDGLVIIGEGKNRVYAVVKNSDPYPLIQVDARGSLKVLGTLHVLFPKGAVFIPAADSDLKTQIFADIPFFIWDLRPQGYLGKIFVSQNRELNIPERWEDWAEETLYRTLCARGEDLPGQLIVGRESFERSQARRIQSIGRAQRRREYPKLALGTLQGTFVGSSAGGEQPKFTALIENKNEYRHVIVKFSMDLKSQAGRRLGDLLFAEEIALNLLKQNNYPSVVASAFESEGMVFLEIERFDRIGKNGRMGVLSLASIDNEFVGDRSSWTSCAMKLKNRKLLSPKDAETIALFDSFGALIANTDRHFGNISIFWELQKNSFALAPIYDMLPMLYAPVQSTLVEREFILPTPLIEQLPLWEKAKSLALEFWSRVSSDSRISKSFRQIANSHLRFFKIN